MSVFIHHDGALGDVLLSLPALHAVRNSGAKLHVAARADVGGLLHACGMAESFSGAGSARYASLHAGKAGDELSAFLTTFERVCLFTVNPASAAAAALAAAVPSAEIIATIPPASVRVHLSDFRLRQLAHAGPPQAGCLLPVPGHYGNLAGVMLRRWGHDGCSPVVAIHPGSGGREKCWPLERFFAVVDRLQASTQVFVMLLTGPAEDRSVKERVEEFARSCGCRAHVSDADLTSVAAALGRCALFVGNDAGIGHLAAAVGCPVLSLFGPTDPALWAPRGPRVEVIAGRTLADIAVDAVYSQAVAMLGMD